MLLISDNLLAVLQKCFKSVVRQTEFQFNFIVDDCNIEYSDREHVLESKILKYSFHYSPCSIELKSKATLRCSIPIILPSFRRIPFRIYTKWIYYIKKKHIFASGSICEDIWANSKKKQQTNKQKETVHLRHSLDRKFRIKSIFLKLFYLKNTVLMVILTGNSTKSNFASEENRNTFDLSIKSRVENKQANNILLFEGECKVLWNEIISPFFFYSPDIFIGCWSL